MIITKSSNVRFSVLTPGLARILYTLEQFHRFYTVEQPKDLVITEIFNTSGHSTGSKHYTNEALDLRSKNFNTRESKRVFRSELEKSLGPKFRVLLESEGTENEHFHIQVKKGETYP